MMFLSLRRILVKHERMVYLINQQINERNSISRVLVFNVKLIQYLLLKILLYIYLKLGFKITTIFYMQLDKKIKILVRRSFFHSFIQTIVKTQFSIPNHILLYYTKMIYFAKEIDPLAIILFKPIIKLYVSTFN